MDNKTCILLSLIFLLIVIMLLLCTSKSTFGQGYSSQSTSNTTPKVSKDSVLIFYAPWCGYCKDSMKEFKKAESDSDGKVILIDATLKENEKLKEDYNIEGYPTIIKGDNTKYTGDRNAKDIVKFAKGTD